VCVKTLYYQRVQFLVGNLVEQLFSQLLPLPVADLANPCASAPSAFSALKKLNYRFCLNHKCAAGRSVPKIAASRTEPVSSLVKNQKAAAKDRDSVTFGKKSGRCSASCMVAVWAST